MNCLRLCRAERQMANIFKITSTKPISGHHIRYTETEERWRERDGVSKNWQLIYKAPMDTQLKYATSYLTFTTTSVGVGGIYYGLFVYDPSNWNQPVLLNEDLVIASNTTECLVYIGTFIALHIALKILLSKYVLRLYQSGDKYTAIYRGYFWNSINKHEFRLKDVKKLKPTLLVTWGDARFGLGSKHGILLEQYFKTPEYFNNLVSGGKTQEIEEK